MIAWLRKLFKRDCAHKWSRWEEMESRSFGHTSWLIRQKRICTECGFQQITSKTIEYNGRSL